VFNQPNLFTVSTSSVSLSTIRSIIMVRSTGLCVLVAVVLLMTPSTNKAQAVQYTKNKPDQVFRSSLRVDPSTLGLSIEVPIAGYPGRGGTSLPINLSYSSKQWRIEFEESWLSNGGLLRTESIPKFSEWAKAGWTTSADIPIIEWTGASAQYNFDGTPFCGDCGDSGGYYINRIQVHMPSGASHELRLNDTPTTSPATVGTYYAVDGSNLRYESSSYTEGTLYLPDGSRYVLNASSTQYIDRNGNTLTYNVTNRQWTDTQGRVLDVPLPNSPSATTYTYNLPSATGTPVSYSVRWSTLANALTNPSELHYKTNMTFGIGETWNPRSPALFNGDGGSRLYDGPGFPVSEKFNPVVLAEIILPNGQHYLFTYNVFGEITKIVYPTGAYERFEHAEIAGVSFLEAPYRQANRGVVNRWLSSTGASADEVPWHYEAVKSNFVLTVSTTTPDNTMSQRLMKAETSEATNVTFGFSWADLGQAFEERLCVPSCEGGAMLRRTLTSWTTSGPLSGGWATASRNPRVIKQVNVFLDTGTTNALTSTTTMDYDGDLNLIATNQYDFTSVSESTAKTAAIELISAGTLLRTQESTYLVNDTTIDPVIRADYRNRHLLSLPTSTRIKNGTGTIVSQTYTNYDESASYPLLTYEGVINAWIDPATNRRGLPTTSGVWLNTTGSYLQTHAQYDQFGNVRNTWDAKGNQCQITYSSLYHYAYPTASYTAVPDPSGQHGSTSAFSTFTTYDTNTGLVLSTTEPNGQTTTMVYGDPMSRVTQVTKPNGAHINYSYSDSPNNLYIRVLTDQDSSRAIETRQYFDNLGRPVRSFLYEGSPSDPWLVTDTYYDTAGRVAKVSNPYRVSSPSGVVPSSCSVCSTSTYDALGRVISVKTPMAA
jgi:hypothetical protein